MIYVKVYDNKHPDFTCQKCTQSRTRITHVLSNIFKEARHTLCSLAICRYFSFEIRDIARIIKLN